MRLFLFVSFVDVRLNTVTARLAHSKLDVSVHISEYRVQNDVQWCVSYTIGCHFVSNTQ